MTPKVKQKKGFWHREYASDRLKIFILVLANYFIAALKTSNKVELFTRKYSNKKNYLFLNFLLYVFT